MSAMQTVAQSLRILGITAERIAASVADRVEDASVRIIVRRAVVDELSWLDRLIAEAETPPRLTDAERAFLRRLQPSEYPLASYSTVISPEERKTVFCLLKRLGGDQ